MRIIRKTPLAKNRKLGISAFVLPVLLATVFLLPGCNMFNKPLSDFLEYWTDVAQISRHSFDGSYPETDGLTNLPSGGDRVITYYLVNPQNYVLDPVVSFASGSLTQGSDYSIEQDASDRTVLRLTLNDSYLQTLDGDGTEISPTVSIMEPNSGRTFGSYTVPVRVNSAPDGVKSPVVLRSGSSPETYILCFNMPDATKANGDMETISVDGNSFNRTYTVDMQNGTISGTGTIYTTKNASWQPVVNGAADFIGDESNRFVGIDTGIPLSGDTVSFTVTTHDSYGLSTSVEAGATASKLEVPTSDPSSGSILQVGDSVTIRHPASSGDNRTLDVHVTDGGEDNVTIVEGTPNAPEVTVTFNTTGTYTLSAQAKMTGAADSDEVTFTYTVKRASTVYVSEIGDDDASGTKDKPVETLQRAIKLLDEAQFTEGEIVVTGTVATEEVIISTLNGTTGSVTILMVRGGADGGTLENENGRVFTIGSGGSVTLGEGITLTGTVTDGNGGAVYVNGGTFTMERDSKITGSSAKYQRTGGNGGAVYVAGGGEFNMNDGSEITGSRATGYTSSFGGAVFIFNGTFNMSGGVIGGNNNEKNTAVCGGGVYVYHGTFNMSGSAQIQGNEATGTGMNDGGGGVYVNGGEFTMSGGTINDDIFADESFALNGAGLVLNDCDITLGGRVSIDVSGVDKDNIVNVGVSLEDAAQDRVVLKNVADIETCIKFSIKNYTDGSDSLMWINYSDGQGILQDIGGTFNEKSNTTPIFTSDDLVLWAEKVNSYPTYVNNNCLLYTDINLLAEEWTPVCTYSNPYSGTFDGNGHTISELVIKGSEDYQGLFGYVGSNGTVKNLTLSNVNIQGNGYENVGGVAGYNYQGKILGCTVSGIVEGVSKACGGIAGFSNNGFIIGCASSCSVTGDRYVGGVVGWSTKDSIVACYNKGSIEVSDDIGGGVVGGGASYKLYGCYSSGKILAEDGKTHIGGIAGEYVAPGENKALYYSNYDGEGIGNQTATTTNVDGVTTTWQEATSAMNDAIIEWNDSNGKLCDWKFQQNDSTDNPPVLVPGAP